MSCIYIEIDRKLALVLLGAMRASYILCVLCSIHRGEWKLCAIHYVLSKLCHIYCNKCILKLYQHRMINDFLSLFGQYTEAPGWIAECNESLIRKIARIT